jgi:hypothetical protein
VPCGEGPSGPFGHARTSAKEEQAHAFLCAKAAQLLDELNAGDALNEWVTGQPRQPDKRHPIGYGEIRAVEDLSVLGRPVRQPDEIGIDGHDLMPPAVPKETRQSSDGRAPIDTIDQDAEQRHSRPCTA